MPYVIMKEANPYVVMEEAKPLGSIVTKSLFVYYLACDWMGQERSLRRATNEALFLWLEVFIEFFHFFYCQITTLYR